ncbi:phosphatidate cytidylyltransferase [Alkalispirochaeta americana]|uniref:Phosphatidate cytidylyltransferase n=1 Tax=Alkalispirochaeta americana TaxID=159291 RepID=A0A1N6PST5_9SPIO|nr:phosphatidate cytidylyltransferase [Alkalispirochaeta americana]SIQ07384.1 phosphatidate cytidylyltransferase [Alkalispirochaeta americana]
MTQNTIFRLLVFFIGIPLLAASALLLPQAGLPAFAFLAIAASALGARETARFFPEQTCSYRHSWLVIPLMGALVPGAGYSAHWLPGDCSPSFAVVGVIILGLSLVMAIQVFRSHHGDFSGIIPSITTHTFVLLYPGLFLWHALRLTELPHPSHLVVLFLLCTYLNDSAAWFFGRLLGKITTPAGAAPPVAISPNKSVAGFVGGFCTTPAVVVVAGLVFPEILPGSIFAHIAFGAIIGVATILGDLVESAMKRSAEIKDSGQLIPGRGGLLDSIDSPIFAAPFFYYGYVLFFLVP